MTESSQNQAEHAVESCPAGAERELCLLFELSVAIDEEANADKLPELLLRRFDRDVGRRPRGSPHSGPRGSPGHRRPSWSHRSEARTKSGRARPGGAGDNRLSCPGSPGRSFPDPGAGRFQRPMGRFSAPRFRRPSGRFPAGEVRRPTVRMDEREDDQLSPENLCPRHGTQPAGGAGGRVGGPIPPHLRTVQGYPL